MTSEEKDNIKKVNDLFVQAITKLGEAKITLHGASDIITTHKLPLGVSKIVDKQIHLSELIEVLEKAKLNIVKLLEQK